MVQGLHLIRFRRTGHSSIFQVSDTHGFSERDWSGVWRLVCTLYSAGTSHYGSLFPPYGFQGS